MAEGFLRYVAGDRFEVFSAGVNPTYINPFAIRVMDEIGIDISGQQSKSIDCFLRERFDYVITLCNNAYQRCPVFHGEYVIKHWNLEDPAVVQGLEEERLNIFRRVRDDIIFRINRFIKLQG